MTDTSESVYNHVTMHRAEVLRELADGYSETQAAEHLGMSVVGYRSAVRELRELTGEPGVRELGRWWRANRMSWLRRMARAGGIESLPSGRSSG